MLQLEDVTMRHAEGQKGWRRPKMTWKRTLRKNMEYLELTEDVAQNRAQWRSRIRTNDSIYSDKTWLLLLDEFSMLR